MVNHRLLRISYYTAMMMVFAVCGTQLDTLDLMFNNLPQFNLTNTMNITQSRLFHTFSESSKQTILFHSSNPTKTPTKYPTKTPTAAPSPSPSMQPTQNPTIYPTGSPTINTAPQIGAARAQRSSKTKKQKANKKIIEKTDNELLNEIIAQSMLYSGKVKILTIPKTVAQEFESELINQQKNDLILIPNVIEYEPGGNQKVKGYWTFIDFALYSCIASIDVLSVDNFNKKSIRDSVAIWASKMIASFDISAETEAIFFKSIHGVIQLTEMMNYTNISVKSDVKAWLNGIKDSFDIANIAKSNTFEFQVKITDDVNFFGNGVAMDVMIQLYCLSLKNLLDAKRIEMKNIMNAGIGKHSHINHTMEWMQSSDALYAKMDKYLSDVLYLLREAMVFKKHNIIGDMQKSFNSFKLLIEKTVKFHSHPLTIGQCIFDWKSDPATSRKDIFLVTFKIDGDTTVFNEYLTELVIKISEYSEKPVIVERFFVEKKSQHQRKKRTTAGTKSFDWIRCTSTVSEKKKRNHRNIP